MCAGMKFHPIYSKIFCERSSWMLAKDECLGSPRDKSGQVSQRKRAVVHLLDWHDSSFRRLRPPATISIGRSRPVFTTIAPDRRRRNGYHGIQLTPSFIGVGAWWELLMVMNLATNTQLQGQSENKGDLCKRRLMKKSWQSSPGSIIWWKKKCLF